MHKYKKDDQKFAGLLSDSSARQEVMSALAGMRDDNFSGARRGLGAAALLLVLALVLRKVFDYSDLLGTIVENPALSVLLGFLPNAIFFLAVFFGLRAAISAFMGQKQQDQLRLLQVVEYLKEGKTWVPGS